MKRRLFLKQASICTGGMLVLPGALWSETFLTLEEAQEVLYGPKIDWAPVTVTLTQEQMKSIQKAAKVRVRYGTIKTWRTPAGDWFILDQVIGKHENIDLAVAITVDGKVKGLEILTYRETYGHEIRNERWRAQFHGRDHTERLILDRQIRNISGATLSCRHVTDGINRLNQTWLQVLRHL